MSEGERFLDSRGSGENHRAWLEEKAAMAVSIRARAEDVHADMRQKARAEIQGLAQQVPASRGHDPLYSPLNEILLAAAGRDAADWTAISDALDLSVPEVLHGALSPSQREYLELVREKAKHAWSADGK